MTLGIKFESYGPGAEAKVFVDRTGPDGVLVMFAADGRHIQLSGPVPVVRRLIVDADVALNRLITEAEEYDGD